MSAGPSGRGHDGGGLRLFYAWVRGTRAVVFRYLEGVPEDVLSRRHPAFRGSMLELLGHVSDCYLHWTGHVGLKEPAVSETSPRDLEEVRRRFGQVDELMERALRQGSQLDAPIDWQGHRLNLRYLVLHPITHEFHHKGQITSLGRLHGHPVPEGTDLDLALPG